MRSESCHELIGNSGPMIQLKTDIDRVAGSDSKVLITGETGVGKELVAWALRASSSRADRPLIPVNCAGLPETLLESELFGHVKGSFTGAYRDKLGKLEMADGGTLFLDEIGEMTLRMQSLLLRFIETGELQKVGADRAQRTTDVRIITATNKELRELIAKQQFREDLYYRLNVIHLAVPPLRERKDDLPLLIDHFLKRFTRSNGQPERTLAPEVYATLMEYPWPGNVRELENLLERIVITSRSAVIKVEDLPHEVRAERHVAIRSKQERRRTVADELYKQLIASRESFWTAVYPLYMRREITRSSVRDLVRKGLQEARGNYKIVLRLFNMEESDYKKFLNFLRKHDCQLPFKDYRLGVDSSRSVEGEARWR